MGTFLCSVAVAVGLPQGASPGSPDSLRQRVTRDTTDGAGWLSLGRALLQTDLSYHTHGAGVDTTPAVAVLSTADLAFPTAAPLPAPPLGSGGGGRRRLGGGGPGRPPPPGRARARRAE